RCERQSALEIKNSTERPASNHGVPSTAQTICKNPAAAEWEFPVSGAHPGPGSYGAGGSVIAGVAELISIAISWTERSNVKRLSPGKVSQQIQSPMKTLVRVKL